MELLNVYLRILLNLLPSALRLSKQFMDTIISVRIQVKFWRCHFQSVRSRAVAIFGYLKKDPSTFREGEGPRPISPDRNVLADAKRMGMFNDVL